MLNIAITGGIGSGKSTVTEYLNRKGYTVIDADKMARELTEPGGRAIPYIIEHFGESYILEDGSMDRAKMRDLIFKDYSQKAILEEGTTKVVLEDIEKIRQQSEQSGITALFYDIPLLFETNTQDSYDSIWVITTDLELRKQRIIERDGIEDHIVDLIIGSQAEEDYKISKADEVIYNNSGIDDLYLSIDNLIGKYNL